MAIGEDVYCTLVMSDNYLPGAAVLAHSLRDAGTQKKLACLITQESLRASTITELQSLYNYVIPVERVGTPNPANLYLMSRPDLLYTFTKINLWRLTQFRKIVYIDSDVVALRAPDELFDVQEEFAAAPDVGWPDAFNTGVMVLSPHMGDYWAMKTLAAAGDSFDGADQGLLNQYYENKPWKRLSFTYNCTPSANYGYEPAYRYFKRDIKMMHFIGKEKPWQVGRAVKGAPGIYQELLSRWWAVYDRHFKVSAHEYMSTGRREPERSHVVQQEVKGETESENHGYYASGYPAQTTQPAPPPEATSNTSDAPMTEPVYEAEAIHQGIVEPKPTVEQRRFSAPHMEWDATRAAPPAESKPEAANFPTSTYEFSSNTEQFRPPASYPEPPKDMWYDVPKEKPRRKEVKPPPIFPWEEREMPKPTRKFVDDEPVPQPPELEPEPEFAGGDELEVTADDQIEPKTPAIVVNDGSPWAAFGTVNKNAWDEVSGIDDYVRALTAFQKNRGKVQVLQHQQFPSDPTAAQQQQAIMSPTREPEPIDLVEQAQKRRESLILTDFPSAVERPSLPVTPAPRRRATFWGAERDTDGDLPPAEGVPDQADWNPEAQLEELRRNSLIGPGDLKLPAKKNIPKRDLPEHSTKTQAELPQHSIAVGDSDSSHDQGGSATPASASVPGTGIGHEASKTPASALGGPGSGAAVSTPVSGAAEKNGAKAAPSFTEPGFGAPSKVPSEQKETVLSPTQTREAEVAP